MATPKESENPQNIVPITLRVAPEQGRYHGVKTPEAIRQQRAKEARDAAKQLLGKHWGKTVFEGPFRVPRPLPKEPGEQRSEPQPFQPNPAEQQAAERLGKPPPEGTSREVLQADELFQTIQELPYNRLLELNPEEYGFSHIGDMLLYMLVERRMAHFPGIYSTVSTRLEQEQHEAIEKVMGGHPSESNEELERTAFRLVDEKFLQVIQELGSHWRKQGRL